MGGRPLPVVHTGLDDAAIADCFRTEVDNELPSGEVVLDFLPDETGACKRNGLFVKVKLCFVTYGFFGIDVISTLLVCLPKVGTLFLLQISYFYMDVDNLISILFHRDSKLVVNKSPGSVDMISSILMFRLLNYMFYVLP